jgi:hypothetical protein
VADVGALHRLVGVLALNRQSGDLGRLIGEEARVIRRDVHRELIETIERRGQQVWIPVTVAALVPGVISWRCRSSTRSACSPTREGVSHVIVTVRLRRSRRGSHLRRHRRRRHVWRPGLR